MTDAWGRYVRASGKDLNWFKRDEVHANERGEQVIGRILAAHLAPPCRGSDRQSIWIRGTSHGRDTSPTRSVQKNRLPIVSGG